MLLLVFAATSQAAFTHPYTGTSFGPGGVGSGSFESVSSVAVDQKSGDVYVLDKVGEEGRLYKFDATGAPIDFSSTGTNEIEGVPITPYWGSEAQVAIDSSNGPAAGDIYVASLHHVLIYSASGKQIGVLEESEAEFHGVSVGPTGELYVSDSGRNPQTVRRFTPTTNPVTLADESGVMSGVSSVQAIATDYAGDVYDNGYGIKKYDAMQFGSLSAEGEVVTPPSSEDYKWTLAVDQADGHVLVDQQSSIEEYEGSTAPPTLIGTVGEGGPGALSNSFGVAIDDASEDLYVGNGPSVEIFGPVTEISSVTTESATSMSSSEATLHGLVYPAGQEVTSCEFEYGPVTITAVKTVQCEPGPPITGTASVPVTARVSGLNAGTAYHFRVVGATSSGTLDGTIAKFITLSAATSHVLPDDRGYERVSPRENADSEVIQDVPLNIAPTEAGHTEQPYVVAPTGEAVAYMAFPGETGGIGREGGGEGNQYVAKRLAAGDWKVTNVEPPSDNKSDIPIFKAFAPDLSGGFVVANGIHALAEDAPGESFSDLYSTAFGTRSYDPANTVKPPHRTAQEFGSATVHNLLGKAVGYGGSSADRNHVLFMANDALTANAPVRGEYSDNLYDSSEGKLTLVNVKPNGEPEAGATFGGPEFEEEALNEPMLDHDVSENGQRIFWTSLNSGDLYVRENDTAPQSPVVAGACTVPEDACTIKIAEEARFWNATPDGSKVLYTEEGGLFTYDLETGETQELATGGVKGVLASTENLEYVYFVANAALAPGATPVECRSYTTEESSRCNLYALHVGESPRFIGKLYAADNENSPESFYNHAGDWQGSLGSQEAETTPDGTHLMFVSRASLTGYENNSTDQAFMYDFKTGEISCLSCKASGAEVPDEGQESYFSAFLPVSHVSTWLPRWMSDDGDRAFFDTYSPLVPQDTNKAVDVYEWERDGTGSCTTNPACIYLLSSGTAREGSFLIGASDSGDDVFITTRSKMIPEDENEFVDVYDVRVGATVPVAAPECTGAGCQGVPAAPPVFATPPSETYDGVGNLEPKISTPATKLTRAQKLKRALRECRKKRGKPRAACERHARQRYGGKAKKSSSSKRGVNGKRTARRAGR